MRQVIRFENVVDIKIPVCTVLIRPLEKTSPHHHYDTVILTADAFNEFLLEYTAWIELRPFPEDRFAFYEVLRKDGTHDFALTARLIRERAKPDEQVRIKPIIEKLLSLDKTLTQIHNETKNERAEFMATQNTDSLDELLNDVTAMKTELQARIDARAKK